MCMAPLFLSIIFCFCYSFACPKLFFLSYCPFVSFIQRSYLRITAISLGEGNGYPLQHSSLGNPMNRGAWLATVHRVTESQTQWKWLSTYYVSVSMGDFSQFIEYSFPKTSNWLFHWIFYRFKENLLKANCFLPVLLRYHWQTELRKFKMYSIIFWLIYIMKWLSQWVYWVSIIPYR